MNIGHNSRVYDCSLHTDLVMDKKLLAARRQLHQHVTGSGGGTGRTRVPANQPMGKLIALGSSSAKASPSEALSASSSSSLVNVKRDGSFDKTGGPPMSKKPRLEPSQPLAPQANISSFLAKKDPTNDVEWKNLAGSNEDFDPADLLWKISSAEEQLKTRRIQKLLCGAVNYLSECQMNAVRRGQGPAVVDPVLATTLAYWAVENNAFFRDPPVLEGLCSLLKRLPVLATETGTTKLTGQNITGGMAIAAFVSSLLHTIYSDSNDWPLVIVKVFLDDSINERRWVDRRDCRALVDNIVTVFNTQRLASQAIGAVNANEVTNNTQLIDNQSSTDIVRETGSDPETSQSGLDTSQDEADVSLDGQESKFEVKPRFSASTCKEAHTWTLDLLQELWSRRLESVSKNVIRTMAWTCGLPQVRLAASQKIDNWLQNAKQQRPALELLLSVFINCPPNPNEKQVEVLASLTRLRALKSKPVLNVFNAGLRHLVANSEANLSAILRVTLHNELSSARNASNMNVLHTCFQVNKVSSCKHLCKFVSELLGSREAPDHVKNVRVLIKELTRTVMRGELPLFTMSTSFMQATLKLNLSKMDRTAKESVISHAVEIVCFLCMVGISHSIKEAFLSRRDTTSVRKYEKDLSVILKNSTTWLQSMVLNCELDKHSRPFVVVILNRLLFAEPKPENYTGKADNWPSEQERSIYLRIIGESPLAEDMLVELLQLGVNPEFYWLSQADVAEIVDALIKRAAFASSPDNQTLCIQSEKVLDLLFRLCDYKPPDTIKLPQDFTFPDMAVTGNYWKVWLMLLIMAAFNPKSVGRVAWNSYPTLKYLMQMAMTGSYTFPPMADDTEEASAGEVKCKIFESEQILLLEQKLADASTGAVITEGTSHLLPLLMALDPKGAAREPPKPIMESVRQLNDQLSVGMMLCRSRNPDFLLDIINKQGATSSLPWLVRLIEANAGSLAVLPVQCLCEFLLHNFENSKNKEDDLEVHSASTSSKKSSNKEKLKETEHLHRVLEMNNRIKQLLWDSDSDPELVKQAVLYFLCRLQAPKMKERNVAITVLDSLLTKDGDEEGAGLVDKLASLPSFECNADLRGACCLMIRKCLLVETDLHRVTDYLVFIEKCMQGEGGNGDDVIGALSSLFVQRQTLLNKLFMHSFARKNQVHATLLKAFVAYFQQVAKPNEDVQWSSSPDRLLLNWHWPTDTTALISVNIVSAAIILLSQGPPQSVSTLENYEYLLNLWFPPDNFSPPTALLADTGEEAELLPDWLQLRVLEKSDHTDSRILNAVLDGLEISQVILFLQASGLPLEAINSLLKLTDRACEEGNLSVDLINGNVCVIRQCIRTHWRRGAVGGAALMNIIDTEEAERMDESSNEPLPVFKPKIDNCIKVNEQKEIVECDAIESVKKLFVKREDTNIVSVLYEMMNSANETRLTEIVEWLGSQMDVKTAVYDSKNELFMLLNQIKVKIERESDVYGKLEKVCSKILAHCSGGNQDALYALCNAILNSQSEQMDVSLQSNSTAPESVLDREQEMTLCLQRLFVLAKSGANCGGVSAATHRYLTLDPDICSISPKQQVNALFSRTPMAANTHLISLIPHKASVSVLKNIVAILTDEKNDSKLDPSRVLNLLETCIKLSRVQSGVELRLQGCVLHLRSNQIESVIGFVIKESSQLEWIQDVNNSNIDHNWAREKLQWQRIDPDKLKGKNCAQTQLKERMELLLNLFNEDVSVFEVACKFLMTLCDKDDSDSRLAHFLLLELYFVKPEVTNNMSPGCAEILLRSIDSLVHTAHNKLDAVLHRLICEWVKVAKLESNEDKVDNINMQIRALAVRYPQHVVRHFALLSSCISGVSTVYMRRLMHTQYVKLLEYVLSLINLLSPTAFDPAYKAPLQGILMELLNLVEYHGLRNKAFGSVIEKTFELLLAYHSFDPEACCCVVESRKSLFVAVAIRYPEGFPKLAEFNTRVVNATAHPSNAQLEEEGLQNVLRNAGLVELSAYPSARPVSPMSTSLIAQLTNRMQRTLRSMSNDCTQILNEIEQLSIKKPEVLELFMSALQQLAFHPLAKCRKIVHELIIRMIRERPSHGRQLLPTLIACFKHNDSSIRLSCLNSLPQFVVLLKEESGGLMQAAVESVCNGFQREHALRLQQTWMSDVDGAHLFTVNET